MQETKALISAMTGESRGCSRAAAPVCGFSRGTTARSVSLSWGAREVGSPCEWRGGGRHSSRAMGGDSGEYCKYCGTSARDARSLLSNNCPKHPNGFCKGKHALYEGGERSEYVCVYCGTKNRSLSSLLNGWCPKHPDGPSRGKHVAYDGRESGPYECKYCGSEFRDIASMVNGWCPKHPNGPSRGKHSPAR